MRAVGLLAMMVFAAAALGCSEPVGATKPTYGGRGRVASTKGGAVVLTYDERVAVAVHRTAGVIRVFHLAPDREPSNILRGISKELDVGVDAKPWAAVIGADDDTAYVLLRGSQSVVRITGLHDGPKLESATAVRVGTDPTDIAITPSGSTLYVANWGEGTVSMISTSRLVAQQYTDLNFSLAATGAFGALSGDSEPSAETAIWTDSELRTIRPGLAHPRALAMTDSGDDTDADEILYATEFFSQAIPGTTNSDPDQQRQGFVYAISMDTGQPETPIPLAPMDTGTPDAEGTPTHCFPNQLFAATVAENHLYVTSMCASPRGPVGAGPTMGSTENFRTLVHPAISVVDTTPGGHREVLSMGGVLTRKLLDRYEADSALDRRMPLIPNDIAMVRQDDGLFAYVTAFGADAVFPIDYTSGAPEPSSSFLDLRELGNQLPIGIAVSRNAARPFALVMNDHSDALSVVSLAERRIVDEDETLLESMNADPDVKDGRRLFATGLGAWSFQGLALSSCESCHPEGLSDGIVWRFPRGPRRTISTAGTYFPDQSTRRMLLWTANVDEIHDVEVIARTVSGGVGGVLWNYIGGNQDCRIIYDGTTPPSAVGGASECPAPKGTSHRLNGLNGSLAAITRQSGMLLCAPDAPTCDVNASDDWDQINAFIKSLRAPKAPRICVPGEPSLDSACLDAALVSAGRDIFRNAQCAGCHGGPGWTVSKIFYTPSLANNGDLPPTKPTPPLDADGVMLESMRGTLRTATYQAGALAPLNPPSAASGAATFRSYAPAAATDADLAAIEYLYGPSDQINCVLRNVGTFPQQTAGSSANMMGIVAPGVTPVEESRRVLGPKPTDGTPQTYETQLAVGKDGINIPSLVGLALGGPLFHAGNARTLEEAFHSAFAAHHRNSVFAPDLELTHDDVRALVSYLLSIDDETDSVDVPSSSTGELSFDPDLCAQFPGE